MANAPVSDGEFVTVVSGIPRSGTSMMLRMLAAGGLEVLTDGLREADADNPHGYFEWEPVKSLKRDVSWVARAVGKGVKIIYYSLYDLPPEYRYRVVLMRRDLDEVLASQAAMLQRRGATGPSPDDAAMKRHFQDELREIGEWLSRQPAFTLLNVDYAAVLGAPLEEARRIAAFLGRNLDCEAMAEMVDPALYRRRV